MTRAALLADICAETCRFALFTGQDQGRPLFSDYDECKVGDRRDAYEAFGRYVERLSGRLPPRLGLSVSGPVDTDTWTVPQSGWSLSAGELKRRFGFEDIFVLNDVAALALSLQCLRTDDLSALAGTRACARPALDGRSAVITVGAGLGVSVVEFAQGRCRATATEAGHISFAPADAVEFEILARLQATFGRVSYERVLSWPGLAQLHHALAEIEGERQAQALTAVEILLFGRTGADPACRRTLDRFFEIFGRFVGDIALSTHATEGVFLAGRFAIEAQDLIDASGFRREFENKGRMSHLVKDLPIWVMSNRGGALTGVARALLDRDAGPHRGRRSARRAAPASAPVSVRIDAPLEETSSAAMIGEAVREASPHGLLVLGPDLRIVGSNERFWAASPTADSLHRAGQSIVDVIQAAEAAGAWTAEQARSMLTHLGARIAFSQERRTFGGRVVRYDAQPSANGGWVVASQEVTTDYRRAEELAATAAELREAKTTAEAANQAKSAFLATMSHEIRTPLNGVLGMAQVMAQEPLSDVQRDRLSVIRESGEALLAILNDILDLSKIESGKLELESIEFDLDEMLLGAYATFTALANKKGLSFTLSTSPAARGGYRGDPTRLRQMLYNLISNAVKFTESGEVRVEADYTDGHLILSVADSGIGIAPDRMARLFDRFVQADSSTTRRFGGTGLGLSICRELASRMGGDISAVSRAGVGATFRMQLPLPRVTIARAGTGSSAAGPGQGAVDGRLRVLAAEDNRVNQLVLKTLLGQIGLDITVVEDGRAALRAWDRESWDLILMDVQMPEMDGPTATRAIRAREAETGRRRTPIIALTANVMADQVTTYIEAGMDGFTAKPIQLASLLEAIRAAVAEGEDEDRDPPADDLLPAKAAG